MFKCLISFYNKWWIGVTTLFFFKYLLVLWIMTYDIKNMIPIPIPIPIPKMIGYQFINSSLYYYLGLQWHVQNKKQDFKKRSHGSSMYLRLFAELNNLFQWWFLKTELFTFERKKVLLTLPLGKSFFELFSSHDFYLSSVL